MPDNLQFERAEQTGTMSCSVCKSPLPDQYHVVNGHVVCDKCRRAAEEHWVQGGTGRLGKAIGLGILATIVCSVAWYLVLKLTGSEFGILAIVVGFVVGGAVRKGSNGRGGWRYQALAIFLTYTAIVSSYVPYVLEGARQQRVEMASDSLRADSTSLAKDSAATAAKAVSKKNPLVVGVALIIGIVLLYALPFLLGFQNLLGLLILGIALFEAWKLNVRTELSVSGPHRVSTSGAPA